MIFFGKPLRTFPDHALGARLDEGRQQELGARGSISVASVLHARADRHHGRIKVVLLDVGFRHLLAQMGLEAKGSTSTELADLLKKDSDRWAPLVKAIGFTADS